jgi:ABC-2 type transport system ATP-binding protein
MSDETPGIDGATVRVTVRRTSGAIVDAVRRLDEAGVGVEDVAVRRATLDDVFLALTGRAAETGGDDADAAAGREEVAA